MLGSESGETGRGFSVWLIDVGTRPRPVVRELVGLGLVPRSEVTVLGRLRDRLPLLIAEHLTATDANSLVERGVRAGAVLEARSFARAAAFTWPVDVMAGLWEEEEEDGYTEAEPSDQLVASLEDELGFRLPDAYVALMRLRNGGMLARDRFPTTRSNSWASDHVAVRGISALGRSVPHSLGGGLGSRFMQEEWGYPTFGVCFADTPTGGHQQLMLDYREFGPDGEPRVLYVDESADCDEFVLADRFEDFILGLVRADEEQHHRDDLSHHQS